MDHEKTFCNRNPFEPEGNPSPRLSSLLPLLFLLAVDVGAHLKLTAVQRDCLVENGRPVWNEETEERSWQEAASFHPVTDI